MLRTGEPHRYPVYTHQRYIKPGTPVHIHVYVVSDPSGLTFRPFPQRSSSSTLNYLIYIINSLPLQPSYFKLRFLLQYKTLVQIIMLLYSNKPVLFILVSNLNASANFCQCSNLPLSSDCFHLEFTYFPKLSLICLKPQPVSGPSLTQATLPPFPVTREFETRLRTLIQIRWLPFNIDVGTGLSPPTQINVR